MISRTSASKVEVALYLLRKISTAFDPKKAYLCRIRTELHELDELIGQVAYFESTRSLLSYKEEMNLQEWLGKL